MKVEVWPTKSKGRVVYHVFFDEFETLPQDFVKLEGDRFQPSDALLFETEDIKVLLAKIFKTIEKEVKQIVKNGL